MLLVWTFMFSTLGTGVVCVGGKVEHVVMDLVGIEDCCVWGISSICLFV